MTSVQEVPAETEVYLLDNYLPVVGAAEIDELRALAQPLEGSPVEMVNSTAVGGGVAEILTRLLPLFRQLGVDAHWRVMEGDLPFFEVTKSFHNALHGEHFQPVPKDFEIFREYNRRNLDLVPADARFVVIHDPQPAALIEARRNHRKNHWIWRCHIDLSRPDSAVWSFLQTYINQYDASIFSSPEYARQLPIPQYLFYPSIDPLSEKNRDLEPEYIESVLENFGIDSRRPILTQISRFDRLKDPLGVIKAYKLVKRYHDCQLVLAGGGATDDPEGAQVLAEVRDAAGNDPDLHVIELPVSAPLEVNALQRASTVIIQKSLREGFGLTVAEGLWKKKPVVASAVGGIPLQVIHKHTGLLTHSIEGTAYQIRFLLSHPEIATRLGEQGHEHVRENFLITGNIKRYLTLFLYLFNS
ncbi:MAG: glycosyltransferase [Bryobacterales bacterium]|nr:glycosyltransferase [Bryobacterales bacterium]MBV9398363.1 glycosyltransferase [Bryobacterales bacterium]